MSAPISPIALLFAATVAFAAPVVDDLAAYVPAGAHLARAAATPKALTMAIERADAALFDAIFTACEPDRLGALTTADFEFDHDQWGRIAKSSDEFVALIRGKCARQAQGEELPSRRELVQGTLAVYPSGRRGAIETGVHRFYQTQAGSPEALVGIARFTHVWRNDDGSWRIARVVSYDHRDVAPPAR
jgi:hypothetical protein